MAIYYVDEANASASDTNSGSEDNPFSTIQHAADLAQPGDIVYVKAGTYDPFEVVSSGTEGNHIVFSAYPGDEHDVIIDAADSSIRGGVTANGQSHFTISGFKIIDAPRNGIFVEGSEEGETDILISNNIIDTTGGAGMFICGLDMRYATDIGEYRLSDVRIEHNEVTNTNYPDGVNEAISLGGGVENFTIAYNWVHHTEQYGIDIKFGARDGEVYGNLIHDVEKWGIYIDSNSRTIENVDIYNNTIYDSRNGIVLARESNQEPLEPNIQNINIEDNLIYDIEKYGILAYKHVWDTETGLFDNVNISSNTVYQTGLDGIRLVDMADYATNFTVADNHVFATGTYDILNRIGAEETGNITEGDPALIDEFDGVDGLLTLEDPMEDEETPPVEDPPVVEDPPATDVIEEDPFQEPPVEDPPVIDVIEEDPIEPPVVEEPPAADAIEEDPVEEEPEPKGNSGNNGNGKEKHSFLDKIFDFFDRLFGGKGNGPTDKIAAETMAAEMPSDPGQYLADLMTDETLDESLPLSSYDDGEDDLNASIL